MTGADATALFRLRCVWGDTYGVALTDGVWSASRLHGAMVLTADSAEELSTLMQADISAMRTAVEPAAIRLRSGRSGGCPYRMAQPEAEGTMTSYGMGYAAAIAALSLVYSRSLTGTIMRVICSPGQGVSEGCGHQLRAK